MKVNPNEPALPKQKGDMTAGLTKLEWAAVQIAAGISSNPYTVEHYLETPYGEDDDSAQTVARMAVALSRALFAELEKQG